MTTPAVADRIHALSTRPKTGTPLVMLTAYDFVSAQIVDAAGVDLILVGDSAATTVLGYETTREVQLDELLMLTRAVRRGVRNALVVGDLPYGTYESSDEQAVRTARALADAGSDLVKLEGAGAMVSRVRAIVSAGIPAVGHVGLLPQAYASYADLRARGRTADEALQIVEDAADLANAGCSALVIEAVPAIVGKAVTQRLSIPVIGIGAGGEVDGQVLVLNDLLGFGEGRSPKFVRPYANLRSLILDAVQRFAADVRGGSYPSATEQYSMPPAHLEPFANGLS